MNARQRHVGPRAHAEDGQPNEGIDKRRGGATPPVLRTSAPRGRGAWRGRGRGQSYDLGSRSHSNGSAGSSGSGGSRHGNERSASGPVLIPTPGYYAPSVPRPKKVLPPGSQTIPHAVRQAHARVSVPEAGAQAVAGPSHIASANAAGAAPRVSLSSKTAMGPPAPPPPLEPRPPVAPLPSDPSRTTPIAQPAVSRVPSKTSLAQPGPPKGAAAAASVVQPAHVKEEEEQTPPPSYEPPTAAATRGVKRERSASPSPLPRRRPIASGVKLFKPVPLDCIKETGPADYKQRRMVWARALGQKFKADHRHLLPCRSFARDDGYMIDWKVRDPGTLVWSDTLQLVKDPETSDTAAATAPKKTQPRPAKRQKVESAPSPARKSVIDVDSLSDVMPSDSKPVKDAAPSSTVRLNKSHAPAPLEDGASRAKSSASSKPVAKPVLTPATNHVPSVPGPAAPSRPLPAQVRVPSPAALPAPRDSTLPPPAPQRRVPPPRESPPKAPARPVPASGASGNGPSPAGGLRNKSRASLLAYVMESQTQDESFDRPPPPPPLHLPEEEEESLVIPAREEEEEESQVLASALAPPPESVAEELPPPVNGTKKAVQQDGRRRSRSAAAQDEPVFSQTDSQLRRAKAETKRRGPARQVVSDTDSEDEAASAPAAGPSAATTTAVTDGEDELEQLFADAVHYVACFLKLFHSTPADLVLAYASAVRFAPDPSGKGKGKAVARPQSRLEVVRALSTLPTARLALAAGAEPAWHAVACGRERGLLVSVAGTLARGKGSAEACGSFVHRFVLKRPEWTEEDADNAAWLWPLVAVSHQLTFLEDG